MFSNNRDRLLEGEVAQEFLALIVEQAPAIPLASHTRLSTTKRNAAKSTRNSASVLLRNKSITDRFVALELLEWRKLCRNRSVPLSFLAPPAELVAKLLWRSRGTAGRYVRSPEPQSLPPTLQDGSGCKVMPRPRLGGPGGTRGNRDRSCGQPAGV